MRGNVYTHHCLYILLHSFPETFLPPIELLAWPPSGPTQLDVAVTLR